MISDSLLLLHIGTTASAQIRFEDVFMSVLMFSEGAVALLSKYHWSSVFYCQVCPWEFFLIQFWFFLLGREDCRQKEEQEGQMGISH